MKKRIISLLLVVVTVLGIVPIASAARFMDIKTTDWYYGYVRDLAEVGIINGMTETTFAPNERLTYGQALKLIALAAGENEQTAADGHWAGGYLALAKEKNWINEDVDLNAGISRLAFCQITARSQNLTQQPIRNPFQDTADPAVLALVNAGVINGMSADTFMPNATLTRAQIAKIIWCIKNPGKTPEPPTAGEIAADKVNVTAVKILETLTMEAESSQKFTVSVEPSNATDKTITWTAGNPGVATIDENGVITAHKVGECHIIATASNGVKAVCLVTVVSPGTLYPSEFKVKTIITSSLSEYNGERDAEYVLEHYEYSEGKLKLIYTVHQDKNLVVTDTERSRYLYDGNYLIEKQTEVREGELGRVKSSETETFSYDGEGNVKKLVVQDDNSNSQTYTYEHDAKGNLLRENVVWSNGDDDNFTYSYEYTYDQKGNQLSWVFSDSNGLYTESKTEYDTYGKKLCTQITHKRPNGNNEVETISCTYNKQGLLASEEWSSTDPMMGTSKDIYEYNQQKQLISITKRYSDGTSDKTEYTYDSKGNILCEKTTRTGYDAFVETKTNTYDEYGNLIKMEETTKFANGAVCKTTKTYEYVVVRSQ